MLNANDIKSEVNNSLGCGKRFKRIAGKQKEVLSDCDFICGVADGWGEETLCLNCDMALKSKWKNEEQLKKLLKGGKLC